MARPIKKGLSYFPFDVDIFKEVKIRILMANYGANGVLLYIYLLTAVYNNGYYIKCNEDLCCFGRPRGKPPKGKGDYSVLL